MGKFSPELLKYISYKLGAKPADVAYKFDELPEVVRDNWLASFGDIRKNDFLRKSPRLVKNAEQVGLASNAAGDFIHPYISGISNIQIPAQVRARSNPNPETIIHEGVHNMDDALYSVINRSIGTDKSFFLPVLENTGSDIGAALPPTSLAEPLLAFRAKANMRPDMVEEHLMSDPHGLDYYKRSGDLSWDLISSEAIAQMLQRPRPFSANRAYSNVVDVLEANPLTRYDITFDNLFRDNSNVRENVPVFVTRTGQRLYPNNDSRYVQFMRQIPEEGIKPIEIKERIYNPRYSDNARRAARGQNSVTWQAMKQHGLIDMKNRKAYVTDDGRRLLEELDRAARAPADKVRIGGLYNE